MRDGFLGRRLTGKARDTDQRFPPKPSDSCGEGLQNDQDVVNREQGRVSRKTIQLIFADDRRDGTLLQSSGDEVMTIEALTFYREEEFAGSDSAGVNGVSVRYFVAWEIAGCGDELCDF